MRASVHDHEVRVGLLAITLAIGCRGDGTTGANPIEASDDSESRMVFHETLGGDTGSSGLWLASDVELGQPAEEDESGVTLAAGAGGSVRSLSMSSPRFSGADRALVEIEAPTASPDTPLQFELSFYDDVRGNRYWTLVTLDDPGPQTLEVSLASLRYDRGIVPRWDDVSTWGMVFRTQGDLRVNSFELWNDEPAAPPSEVEWLRERFDDPAAVRVDRRRGFVLMTDAPDLQTDTVLDALIEMEDRTRARLPGLPKTESEIPLLVFADEAGYRAFWSRWSTDVGSGATPLREDDGYTWLGVATASYSDHYGPVRPVYVHEASHALLERSLGISGQRSWLFEGLGIVDQLEISAQDLGPVYRQGLMRSDLKTPTYELVSGGPISTARYWQAAMLLQWVLADPGRTAALNASLDQMRARGSTDLRPLLEPFFGLDMPRFSAAFWSWAWSEFARGPGS